MLFLFVGAAQANQLGGDLGARAQGADTDVAAAQLFRYQAHSGFPETEAAPFFGHGEAENAKLGHLFDHRHRNEVVV